VAVSNVELIVDATKAINPLKRVTSETKKLEGATRDANGRLKDAKGRFIGAGKGATAAAGGVRGLGAALKTALGPLTAAVAAAASLSQVFSILSQQDFAEAKVRSLGVNSDELTARLKDVSRELSGQASVVDLTSAAYDVASAGFTNAADAANILKAASQGATGGFSDINTVGDATTSVLNAYGLEADKAAKLVDGFIQTQNDGKIVIGEYAANIAKVAPVAAALGVPLEEVNAAVAQITAGGQGAEVTFTALKTAFAQVAAGKVGKEFKALGVEINASTLKSDGLAGTLEKIKKSGADAGTVIKAFGTEAGPSILALLNNTEKYNKLLENQKNAQGAAAKAAFEASDTIDGQLKRLTTAFQNLFSDQSELGIIIKETFKVAAVTVEVFGVALSNTLAPIRAIFAAANQVGEAVAEALGFKGVNAAFELEKAFQATLGRAAQFGEFVIGLGVRLGKLIGGLASQIITAGKNSLGGVVGFFKTALENIVGFIGKAYNLIPAPIRNFLEKGVSAVTGFVQETIDLGKGVTLGESTTPSEKDLPQNVVQPTGGALKKSKTKDQIEKERLAFLKQINAEINRINDAELKGIEAGRKIVEQIDARGAAEIKRGETNIALLKAKLDGRLEEEQLAQRIKEIEESNLNDIQKKRLIEIAKGTAALEKQIEVAEKLDQVYKSIGSAVSDGIVNALTAAVDGTKKLADVAADTLRKVADILLQLGVNTALGGISTIGGAGSIFDKLFGGFRASGGSVKAGSSYMVGERGPELFTPGRSGSIAPSGSFGGANVTVNVDASGTQAQGNQPNAKLLGQAIGAAVQAELVKQKRPGGLLAV
jgi:TP901 family phage tail tape measure protein